MTNIDKAKVSKANKILQDYDIIFRDQKEAIKLISFIITEESKSPKGRDTQSLKVGTDSPKGRDRLTPPQVRVTGDERTP